jgi:hypothetical protein
MLPEDGRERKHKYVGAVIYIKTLCNKLVLNVMYVYHSVDKLETGFLRNPSALGSFIKSALKV